MASKSGILETKGGHVKHKKDLWVVVKDHTLYIYKEENQTSDPIDWFSLSGAEVRAVDTKDSKSARDFCFVVSSPKKVFKDHKFYPKTDAEMHSWMQAINSTPLTRSVGKGSMSNLFGVDLEVSCYKAKSTIPSVITQCIDYLQKHIDVQGIFRISASSTDVDTLKSSFDNGTENLHAISDPNIVANVMKLYLRELPNPLVPYEMYDKFVFVSKESKDNQLTHTTDLFRELPKNNQDTLAYLFSFLKKVSERDSINKMTAQNLAVVFAPSILKPREETMTTIGNSEIINSLVEKWILNYDVVFKGIGTRSISPNVMAPPPAVTPSPMDQPPKRVAPSPIKKVDPVQAKPGSFSTLPNMDELNAKLKAPVPSVNVTSPGQPRPPVLNRSTPNPRPGAPAATASANPLPLGPGQLKRTIVSDPNFRTSLPSQSLDSMIKKDPETNLKVTKSSDGRPGNRLSTGNVPTGVNIPPPVAPMVTLPPPINLPPPIVQSDTNKLAPPKVKKSPSMEEGLSALLAKQPSLEDKMKSLEDLQTRNAELVKRIQKHIGAQ